MRGLFGQGVEDVQLSRLLAYQWGYVLHGGEEGQNVSDVATADALFTLIHSIYNIPSVHLKMMFIKY